MAKLIILLLLLILTPPALGVELQGHISNDTGIIGIKFHRVWNSGRGVEIDEVYKDSPAQKSGLQRGDNIRTIDGISVFGLYMREIKDLLNGPPESNISLTIFRDKEWYTITVTRIDINQYNNDAFKEIYTP